MDQDNTKACEEFLTASSEFAERVKNEDKKFIEILVGKDRPSDKIRSIKQFLLEIRLLPLEPLPEIEDVTESINQFKKADDETEGGTLQKIKSLAILVKAGALIKYKEKLDQIARCVKAENLTDEQKLDKISDLFL